MATSAEHSDDLLLETLAAVAPGTELRDGLERILRGRTGALIVLGIDETVEEISTGGFVLDVPFSATRLRELCKMDGAVVVDRNLSRIVRAAVQLLPDPTIETSESGTRHRTAERVAKQTGFPVISVSQSMRIVALYVGHTRYVLEDTDTILSRANQALATLERYRARLDEVAGTLSALEIEDLVTVRDVCSVPLCSDWRWLGGSPTKLPAMSLSLASMGASWRFSWTNSSAESVRIAKLSFVITSNLRTATGPSPMYWLTLAHSTPASCWTSRCSAGSLTFPVAARLSMRQSHRMVTDCFLESHGSHQPLSTVWWHILVDCKSSCRLLSTTS